VCLQIEQTKGRLLDCHLVLLQISVFYFVHHPTFIALEKIIALFCGKKRCKVGFDKNHEFKVETVNEE
jgi:hypothetical protein